MVFLPGSRVSLNPINGYMFPGNLNGHERETWWFEGFLGILKVQVYCITKKGKSCWRWPGASGEQTPAKWFIMQLFFIISNELNGVFLWQSFWSNLDDWTSEMRHSLILKPKEHRDASLFQTCSAVLFVCFGGWRSFLARKSFQLQKKHVFFDSSLQK